MTSLNIENHLQQLYYVYYFDMWFLHLKIKNKIVNYTKGQCWTKEVHSLNMSSYQRPKRLGQTITALKSTDSNPHMQKQTPRINRKGLIFPVRQHVFGDHAKHLQVVRKVFSSLLYTEILYQDGEIHVFLRLNTVS